MVKYVFHETAQMSSANGLELASFCRRAGAFLLDIAFAAGLFSMIASLVEPLLIEQGWINSKEEIRFALNMNWYSIVWTILYFGMTVYLGNGKSPGKWILGIRIISLSHERISVWHSVERSLGYGYSFLELCFGFIQYFIYPNGRTLHDRIAETIVIREIKTR